MSQFFTERILQIFTTKTHFTTPARAAPQNFENDNREHNSKYHNVFYLLSMFTITMCVYKSMYLDECVYFIGVYTIIDLITMKKRTVDMVLHHLFALCIFFFFCTYSKFCGGGGGGAAAPHEGIDLPITYNLSYFTTPARGAAPPQNFDKEHILKNILITEVSSIFLSANYLIPNKYTVVTYLNYCAFISTFLYYRIYNYHSNIILSYRTNVLIINISKNVYHVMIMYIGIYGLFAVNLYWVPCILLHIYKKVYTSAAALHAD